MSAIEKLTPEHSDVCGCGHEHHHEHDASCGCGHAHHHEHNDSCGCEHAHHHEHDGHEYSHGQEQASAPADGKKGKKIYILENLGCANCAAKMEQRINELPEVTEASITFATKQLRLTASHYNGLLSKIQEICSSIEPEVVVREKETSPSGRKKSEQKTDAAAEKKKNVLCIGIGAVLFILGEILEHTGFAGAPLLAIFVAAYAVLGGKVVLTALRNLIKGQIFDENFLMSLATLGAFAIQEYPEAVGVMLFYRIGEFFEEKAVAKSRSQIMDAVDLRPETVNLANDNEIQVIPAEDAVPGDVLLVRPGDRIPLDGIVIEGESRIDTSPITGEPVPVHASAGDEVLSGCVNTSGQLKLRVTRPLEESMVTRILDSVENAAASKPKVDRFITRFARIYTPVVVLLALGTALLPPLLAGGDWNYWVYTAMTFLVMSCPCALVLSVPLAFFSGIGAGSKKGILFKGGVALEMMSGMKAVVMDKTGTVTEGNFVLQKTMPAADLSEKELLRLAASCEQFSTHPIAHSIVTAAKEQGLELQKPSTLKEIAGEGILAVINGRAVLVGNRKLMEHHLVKLSEYKSEDFGTEVLVAAEGIYSGCLVISDTVKSDARQAVQALKKLNIRTAMLTGDAENAARAVASQTGIDEVHARLMPQDKLSILQELRQKYGSVMFVGDGINDAPVLAGADVGAAMGSGADAAIEAADVVFMTSSMVAVPQALGIAKTAVKISWQNIVFALAIKIIVMILGLCGFASMWMAVFADTGVAMLCVLNSVRILYKKQ